MANDFASRLSDERDNRMRLLTQRINKIGLSRSIEGRCVYRTNGRSVLLSFCSNDHALTRDVSHSR